MEMTEKKPYLYFPKFCNENRDTISKKMQNDFDPIIKLASVFGITFSSSFEDEVAKRKNCSLKRIYDVIINLLAIIVLITTIAFAHNFALSNAMMITYCIKYTGSLLIRLNMLVQCSKIPVLFDDLSQLLTDVSTTAYKSFKVHIYLQCLISVILNFILLALTHLHVFYESGVHNLSHLSILGHNVTNDGHFNVVHFVFAAYSVNFAFSVFTVAICVMACMNVHVILRRIIRDFSDVLLENLKSNSTKEELTNAFINFRRIVCGVTKADDVLSFCTFFSYVTCISCFFYSLSSFMTDKQIGNRPFFAAEQLSIFVFANVIFLTITCSASRVSSAIEDLKKKVNCMSEVVMKANLPCDTLLNFMILIDNIKSTDVGMTGWGMFTITRGFVLTTIGVMITYGMILFQFG